MQAHLLEMKLYQDEPGLLFRAQGNLLLNNFRYLGHMLRPALYLALPMVVLFAHFDSVYGQRALRVGRPRSWLPRRTWQAMTWRSLEQAHSMWTAPRSQ